MSTFRFDFDPEGVIEVLSAFVGMEIGYEVGQMIASALAKGITIEGLGTLIGTVIPGVGLISGGVTAFKLVRYFLRNNPGSHPRAMTSG